MYGLTEFQIKINKSCVSIFECPLRKAGEKSRNQPKKIIELKNPDQILIKNIIKNFIFSDNETKILSDDSGMRLAVLFNTLKGLTESQKTQKLFDELLVISDEEIHYWFSKMYYQENQNAGKALHILLLG